MQLRVRILRANFNERYDLLNEPVGRRSLPPVPIRHRVEAVNGSTVA